MLTALDIVTGALQEINAVAQGETPESGDAVFALSKLNDLMDEWSARKFFIYDVNFPLYTLVPSLNPQTIGPMVQLTSSSRTLELATFVGQNYFSNGDNVQVINSTNGLNVTGRALNVTAQQFSIGSFGANIASVPDSGNALLAGSVVPTFATPNNGPRPQKIVAASIVLNSSDPNVDVPVNIRDDKWWMNNRSKGTQSDIPTDLYYNPNFPNGAMYLWPVPSSTYQIRLETWGTIGQFPSLSYQFSLPPGYQKAIKMSLARDLIGPFQGSWGQQQESSWMRAMKAVEINNMKSPRGVSIQPGMPGSRMGSGFNYQTALPEGT